MVIKMELTHHEVAEVLDRKCIDAKSFGYTFLPGIYEVFDNNLLLKSLLPDDVKVFITIDDISSRSILTTDKTIRFTKTVFSILY